jgi:hypothetical protein
LDLLLERILVETQLFDMPFGFLVRGRTYLFIYYSPILMQAIPLIRPSLTFLRVEEPFDLIEIEIWAWSLPSFPKSLEFKWEVNNSCLDRWVSCYSIDWEKARVDWKPSIMGLLSFGAVVCLFLLRSSASLIGRSIFLNVAVDSNCFPKSPFYWSSSF